jgi:hypothetical protein
MKFYLATNRHSIIGPLFLKQVALGSIIMFILSVQSFFLHELTNLQHHFVLVHMLKVPIEQIVDMIYAIVDNMEDYVKVPNK